MCPPYSDLCHSHRSTLHGKASPQSSSTEWYRPSSPGCHWLAKLPAYRSARCAAHTSKAYPFLVLPREYACHATMRAGDEGAPPCLECGPTDRAEIGLPPLAVHTPRYSPSPTGPGSRSLTPSPTGPGSRSLTPSPSLPTPVHSGPHSPRPPPRTRTRSRLTSPPPAGALARPQPPSAPPRRLPHPSCRTCIPHRPLRPKPHEPILNCVFTMNVLYVGLCARVWSPHLAEGGIRAGVGARSTG